MAEPCLKVQQLMTFSFGGTSLVDAGDLLMLLAFSSGRTSLADADDLLMLMTFSSGGTSLAREGATFHRKNVDFP